MKKLALLVVLGLIATGTFAQHSMTGPKAKNAQLGKISTPKITIFHDAQVSGVQGPLAKNTEIWMEEPAKKFKVGFRDEIDNPQGLKAKNANPWDKTQPKVESKAVYQEPKSMRPKKGWIH